MRKDTGCRGRLVNPGPVGEVVIGDKEGGSVAVVVIVVNVGAGTTPVVGGSDTTPRGGSGVDVAGKVSAGESGALVVVAEGPGAAVIAGIPIEGMGAGVVLDVVGVPVSSGGVETSGGSVASLSSSISIGALVGATVGASVATNAGMVGAMEGRSVVGARVSSDSQILRSNHCVVPP